MNKAVEDSAIPNQKNEEAVEAEVISEVTSGAPEDLYVDTSYDPYANIGAIDEAIEYDEITDQQNKEAFED